MTKSTTPRISLVFRCRLYLSFGIGRLISPRRRQFSELVWKGFLQQKNPSHSLREAQTKGGRTMSIIIIIICWRTGKNNEKEVGEEETEREEDHKRSHQRQPFWVHQTKDKSRFSNKWKKHLLPNIWNFIPENEREREENQKKCAEEGGSGRSRRRRSRRKPNNINKMCGMKCSTLKLYTPDLAAWQLFTQATRLILRGTGDGPDAWRTQREGKAWKRHWFRETLRLIGLWNFRIWYVISVGDWKPKKAWSNTVFTI